MYKDLLIRTVQIKTEENFTLRDSLLELKKGIINAVKKGRKLGKDYKAELAKNIDITYESIMKEANVDKEEWESVEYSYPPEELDNDEAS